MSEQERKAWEAGYSGGPAPSGSSALDNYNAGRETAAATRWELDRQASAGSSGSTFSPTFPAFPTTPTGGQTIPSGGTSTPMGEGAIKGLLGCLAVLLLFLVGGSLLSSLSALWIGVFPLWLCLYPLSSLSTLGSGIGAYQLLQQWCRGRAR